MLAGWDPRDRRVRIAFCEDRYHSFYGAQQNLVNLAKNLPVAGFSARVLTTKEGLFSARCRAAGLNCEILPMGEVANRYGGEVLRYNTRDKLRTGVELGRYNVGFWRWLRRERIEVVVCNSPRLALSLGPATRAAGVPMFVFLQGEGAAQWLRVASLVLCRRMMLIASGLRSEFPESLLCVHGDKLRTLNTGFQFESLEVASERGRLLRQRWGVSRASVAIGLVGSISERKGADILAEAAPQILRAIPEAHFVLVGNVPPGNELFLRTLERRVRQLGLESRWTTTGFQDDMAAAYGALDLCVLPSRAEGLPGVTIESMGYGVPCVATRVGGTADVIHEPRYGRVVPPEDPQALASAVAELWRDEPSDGSLAGERSAWTRGAFSVERYVETFVDIVRELVPRATYQRSSPTGGGPAPAPAPTRGSGPVAAHSGDERPRRVDGRAANDT
jgi:L-malate glycosyltransferase